MITFSYKGEVPSKKNSYRISGNRLIKPMSIKDFEESFYYQFKNAHVAGLAVDGPCAFEGVFYVYHDRDLDNMVTSVLDALQLCKALTNDKFVVDIKVKKMNAYLSRGPGVDIRLALLDEVIY